MARLVCRQPTLESSVGIFARLVRLIDKPDNKFWYRHGCVNESALVYPDGLAGAGIPAPDAGIMLSHLAPWLLAGYVKAHTTTIGNAFLEATKSGRYSLDLPSIGTPKNVNETVGHDDQTLNLSRSGRA